jgi:hypothetical protein
VDLKIVWFLVQYFIESFNWLGALIGFNHKLIPD